MSIHPGPERGNEAMQRADEGTRAALADGFAPIRHHANNIRDAEALGCKWYTGPGWVETLGYVPRMGTNLWDEEANREHLTTALFVPEWMAFIWACGWRAQVAARLKDRPDLQEVIVATWRLAGLKAAHRAWLAIDEGEPAHLEG